MNENIIATIDKQIAELQQAKAILIGSTFSPVKRGRGRPKGSKTALALVPARKKRVVREETKAKMALGQKKRHAAKKRAAKKAAAETPQAA